MGKSRGDGFSMIELVMVLAVGGILMGIVLGSFGEVGSRMSVRAAQNAFLSAHAQARALAVERGEVVRLVVSPSTATVTIERGPVGSIEILEILDLGADNNVSLATSGGTPVTLCMTPRGYADPTCNSFNASATVDFSRGGRVSRVRLLPLGQVETP